MALHSHNADNTDSAHNTHSSRTRGLLAWFATNHVAANLLMLLLLVAGSLSLSNIKVEIYPQIESSRIRVSVPYPGASPTEVEQGVCVHVEEALEGIVGLKEIRVDAIEGQASITLKLEEDIDRQNALDQVKAALDRINTFPQDAEEPEISISSHRSRILSVVVSGQTSERVLHHLADDIRGELLGMPGVSHVSFFGNRVPEIAIEVSEETLRRYGLRFGEVATAIEKSSLDVPAGSLKSVEGEVLLRTLGQRYEGQQFEDIAVRTQPDGTVLRVSDIATVIDGFAESELASAFDGKPSVVIWVFAATSRQVLDLADKIKRYVEHKQTTLPDGISLAVWLDRSESLQSRFSLLIRNAIAGLALVITCLTLFLDVRLAFWTAMGMAVSFMGAFWFMPPLDVSLNMTSLFALLMVLGLVVDDAIVVSENIFAQREAGRGPLESAILGVREMAMPVTLAVLTTVVAFAPLMSLGGWLGQFLKAIPIVVMCVLLISLVEALLILPAHLSNLRIHSDDSGPGLLKPITRLQTIFRNGLQRFIHGLYVPLLRRAIAWPYITVAIAVCLFVITIGYINGGYIKIIFFPTLEADNVWATLTMPQGTTRAQTEAILSRVEDGSDRLREEFSAQVDPADLPLIRHRWTTIGMQPFGDDLWGGPPGAAGPHMAEVSLEMPGDADRPVSSTQLAARWRELVEDVPGVKSLRFSSVFFSAGESIHVKLSHPDSAISLQAAARLKRHIRGYAGVKDVQDSAQSGKVELKLRLTEQGRLLGLTLADLAGQIRQGFYGHEVQRIQRGRDEVKVMVRYPSAERRTLADVEQARIRTPAGAQLPFRTVAEVDTGRGFAAISRVDRQRVITVTAEVDETVANGTEINTAIKRSVLPALQQEFPGLTYRFGGRAGNQRDYLAGLKTSFVLALLAIFALLAVHFRSYSQPLIIMSVIPFGLVGAVIGHVAMGLDLSMVSGFGLVALTGIVVNDSLIMVDVIKRHQDEASSLTEIVILAGTKRFRPIILTTLTTFFGLMPIIFEQSVQAQFLMPMALTLGVGVVFATGITLLLVPAVYIVLEDVRGRFVGQAASK